MLDKRVLYQVRKDFAVSRRRVGGRFIKKENQVGNTFFAHINTTPSPTLFMALIFLLMMFFSIYVFFSSALFVCVRAVNAWICVSLNVKITSEFDAHLE